MILFFAVIFPYVVNGIALKWSCDDFQEGTCDLVENNIVGYDRFTNTPGECQSKCQSDSSCIWFTHFDTQCYLLADCGNIQHCDGCTSGPKEPDYASCQGTPGPVTTTTSSATTTTTTSTTVKTSTTTTTVVTTTTTSTCDDIYINELCDWGYSNIAEYNTIMTGAECQSLCRAVTGALYFAHYNHGTNGHKGKCACFHSCSWPEKFDCRDSCGALGLHDCHCMRGPLNPSVDDCDLFPLRLS